MFRTVFKGNLLITLREKPVLFWSLAFPLILSTLFYLAFGNLGTAELIREPIRVAYVAPQVRNPFYDLKGILEGMQRSSSGTDKLFDIYQVSEDEARRMVAADEADAALVDGDTPQLLVKKVEPRQVVVKQVLDQVDATKNTIFSLLSTNPLTDMGVVQTQLSQADFVKVMPLGGQMSADIIYFMALLGMTCLGACSAGAAVVIRQQANRSPEGARAAASAANKWGRVGAAALATWLVQVGMTLVVYAYMRFGLGRDFGPFTGYILLVLALGTLMGFLMGMAIACAVRGKDNTVLGITTGAYLFSSFLSGLMSDKVKRMIDVNLPWLSRINPGSMIVDSLYSLYYYQSVDTRYLVSMTITCLVFSALVIVTLGRHYHDSI
ncbi:MAG: ABC transporter permease [Clostridiales bacterium]|nr:ABC transporter permease [Clostridiales bacterium]